MGDKGYVVVGGAGAQRDASHHVIDCAVGEHELAEGLAGEGELG